MDIEAMRDHYATLPVQGGFESRCRIELPDDLTGATALDMCCRRGKGVFKLSERVGAAGRAIGVDWREDHVAAARHNAPAALLRSGLVENNMAFHVAYPEDLSRFVNAGSIDIAFINDVLNIVFSPTETLAQICTALKPGGLLVCQTVIRKSPCGDEAIEAARADGDSVLAAPDRRKLDTWLKEAGFGLDLVKEVDRRCVEAKGGHYIEVLLHAKKAGGARCTVFTSVEKQAG